jgi:hypothetical protein
MEYQRILQNNANNKNKIDNNILSNDKDLLNKDDNNILQLLDKLSCSHRNDDLTDKMKDDIRYKEVNSERLDKLFRKLHHIEYIDANGCIMIKPPKLQRTTNIDCINNKPFSITTLEHKISKFNSRITLLEDTLNIEEKIALYENRLNKLEEFVVCKNEKNLYDEN